MPNQKSTKNRKSKTVKIEAAPLPTPLGCACSAKELLERFRKLLPARLLQGWLAQAPQQFYERAFTPLITLWYFLFQWLSRDSTLTNAMTDALNGGADRLSPRGKRLSEQLKSTATTSLSDARQRLPLPAMEQTLPAMAQAIRSDVQGLQRSGWEVMLLDGSTLALRPFEAIRREFPPHRSGNSKAPYWCLARVVVGFCLASGVVLDSVMGPTSLSEQALAVQLLGRRQWGNTLGIGDRNLGVYQVARAGQAAGAQVLLRLTKVRARKLARSAGLELQPGLDAPVTWSPSSRDQCPEGLERKPVAGRLLAVRIKRPGFRPVTLYLFTTLTDTQLYPVQALVELYGQRWHAELDLRYVKAQMGLAQLECKSADLARKEWLGGLLAYNLIRSVMVAAAAQARVPVLVLSFARARQFVLDWLVRWATQCFTHLASWEKLLDNIGRCRLPKRRKRRPPEPRAVRYHKKRFPMLKGSRAAARRKLKMLNRKS